MAKKNKPTLDESQYFDDIQSQITELMGPPPLQTTPASNNSSNSSTKKIQQKKNPPVEIVGKPIVAKQETVPNQKEAQEKKDTKELKTEDSEPNIEIDKSKTIEQVQSEAAKKENEAPDIYTDGEKIDSIYSAKVQNAVSDIEARENEIDEPLDGEPVPVIAKKPKKKTGNKFNLFAHKKLIVGLIVALILILFVVPVSRYAILNLIGVRASLSLTVIDATSLQPINNAEISLNGSVSTTNNNGETELKNVKLGNGILNIKKRSFAPLEQSITVGWGSNPIDESFKLVPAGTSYSFLAKDYISGQPIEGIKIASKDTVAITNKDGLATIKIEGATDDYNVQIKSELYRDESVNLPLNNKEQQVINAVPAQPNIFVSNRDGKYNLYKRDVDGKNETIIFPATGNEVPQSMSIMTKPKSSIAAFVSTREGQKNNEGYFLSNLYIIDANKKNASRVETTQSEQIKLIGWSKDSVIFVKTVAGPSGNQDGRQRIVAYNVGQNKYTELAKADSFNDVLIHGDSTYYAVSGSGGKLYKINNDGSTKKVVLGGEVWALQQVDEAGLIVRSADRKIQSLNFETDKISTIEINPGTNSPVVSSPDSKHFAYIERRDGKNVLIVTGDSKNKIEKLYKLPNGNLSYPINWLNDRYFIVHSSDSRDSASLVVNIDSSQVNRIGDEYQIAGAGGVF
jgi:hypothetical protein